MHKVATIFLEAKLPNVEALDSVEVLASKTLLCNKTQFQKITVDVSKKIVLFAVKQIKDFDSNAQHVMLEKFLSHPLFNGMLLDYLVDLKCVKQNHEILSKMKVGITQHLKGQRKFDLVVTKKILCMLASSSSNGNNKCVARVLGVDKHNI